MRRLLLRSVAALAVTAAVATVFARNADGEAAHGDAHEATLATAVADGSRTLLVEAISLASIGAANASNIPGGSSAMRMMVTDEQRAAIRVQLDMLGLTNVSRADPKRPRLAIGTRLPRERTRLSPVPSQIARIVPRYGAYEYFLTETGALVIVDPSAYEIVDMIGA